MKRLKLSLGLTPALVIMLVVACTESATPAPSLTAAPTATSTAGPTPTATPAPMGSMSGVVTTIVDGVEQLPEFDTEVILAGGPVHNETSTAADGRYVFEQVPARRYMVGVRNSYGWNDPAFDCFIVDIPENDTIEFDIVVYVSSIQVRRLLDVDYSKYEDIYSVYASRMVEGGAPVVPPTPIVNVETGAKARVSGLVTTIVDGREQAARDTDINLMIRGQLGYEGSTGYHAYVGTSGEYDFEEVQGGDYILWIRNSYGSAGFSPFGDCVRVHVPESSGTTFNILVTVTSLAEGSDGKYEMHAEVREY